MLRIKLTRNSRFTVRFPEENNHYYYRLSVRLYGKVRELEGRAECLAFDGFIEMKDFVADEVYWVKFNSVRAVIDVGNRTVNCVANLVICK